MASPQCEHGFTRIANELLDAALEILPSEEFHVWAALVRLTYGYGRTSTDVGTSALARMCGMPERTLRRVRAALVARGALYIQRQGPRAATITMEKNYDAWQKDRPKMATQAKRPAKNGHSRGLYQLEKERKIYMGSTDDFLRVSTAYHERIRETHPALAHALKPASDRAGALALSRLVKIDGCDWETVKEVLRWVLKDEFWSRQLISLASLRSKSSRNGLTKFANAMTAWDLSRARPAGMAHVIEQAACRPAAPGEALTVRLFPEEDTGPAEAV